MDETREQGKLCGRYRCGAEAEVLPIASAGGLGNRCCRERCQRSEPPLSALFRLKPEQRAMQVIRHAPKRTRTSTH
jgi:hypothetical protein